jgi:diaminohydroxyphosphoribosylaminopyrimidine deaminase/5-amino-6-(5-phosphoribosylamino)uracil reductase
MDARVDFNVLQPVKVVLDSRLQMPLAAKMLKGSAQTWIITCSSDSKKQRQLEDLGCKVWRFEAVCGRPDLLKVFQFLAKEKINSVWIEAGATLNGSLLSSELVDEWIIYMAPCILGNQGRGMFHLPALQTMAEKKQMSLIQSRQIGQDLRLMFRSRTK